MHQHWIFKVAEDDPDKLLSMSEDDFREALADAGFDADELVEQFHHSVAELLSKGKGSEKAGREVRFGHKAPDTSPGKP